MKLQILTPEKVAFQGEVESIQAPGKMGGFEILKNHAPFLSSLMPGTIRIQHEKREHAFFVTGGFLEFNGDEAVVLAESAEAANVVDMSATVGTK